MKTVTFQVVEGIDKGRVFRDVGVPVTIGREEGNVLRLNDERVSRFHAKVQFDKGDIILTDLDSTNGTRVNGHPVQIRRLQPGDRVGVGRSELIFGSNAEIGAFLGHRQASPHRPTVVPQAKTVLNNGGAADLIGDFDLADVMPAVDDRFWSVSDRDLPPLPQKLAPAQAARLAEVLDFLHRGLAAAIENVRASDDNRQVTILLSEWQKIQGVQMLLSRYLRAVAEPDALVD